MMKKIVIVMLCVCASIASFAQLSEIESHKDNVTGIFQNDNPDTVAWLHNGVVSLGMNQGILHNWSAGGELASLSVNAIVNAQFTRLKHNKVWTINVEGAYTLLYNESNSFVPRKTDDRLDITSKYGVRFTKSEHWYVAGLFNFKSQFTNGFDYEVDDWKHNPVSRFLSPAYFTLAAGLEYRRGTALSLFFTPVAGRAVIADKAHTSIRRDGDYGIAYGKTEHTELGAYFSGRYNVQLSKNVTYRLRVDLYGNYLAKDRKDEDGNILHSDHPGNIDILWDNLLTLKFGRHLDINVGVTAVYDNDTAPGHNFAEGSLQNEQEKNEVGKKMGWWQIKELMTLGLAYNF